ncbi:MAG: hypothetical protein KatS3mg065_0654 [Chloroflexota bacterium]|nr:MAG: hypothetical protein KatS3mg065_0654 [Chloroflexota bacterium]
MAIGSSRGPRVADAGRAAVAGDGEAEGLEGLEEPRPLEIARHRLRAGGEGGLDDRRDAEAPGDGVPGQEPGPDHDRRVRGVRAGGDGGDGDRARADGRPLPGDLDLDRSVLPPVDGRERCLDLGAFGRPGDGDLGLIGRESPRIGTPFVRQPGLRRPVPFDRDGDESLGEVRAEVLPEGPQGDAVLGPPRPGDRRLHGRQIELEEGVELGTGARLAPQALLLRIPLDEGDPFLGAAGEAEVGEGLGVDGEEGRRRAELGAHVADRRPVGEGEAGETVAGEFDPGSDDPEAAEHLGDDEDEIGRRRARRQLAGEADPDDPRHRDVEGLAEEDGLGLDPADAVAEDAEGVDHRRVGIGPDEGVGVGDPAGAVLVGGVGDDGRQDTRG